MNVERRLVEKISFTVFIEPLTERELEILQLIAGGLLEFRVYYVN